MRVLVVGGGGREHALAWKLSQSPRVEDVFTAPGNAGLATLGACVPIHHTDIVELADFAESVHLDLTVVGPELPLTLGIVDEFTRRGLRIFGPTQSAAELEGSKVFSKRFMERHGIPTAAFRVASSRPEAEDVLDSGELGWPVVVKADGLAAGKGVIIAGDRAEADRALQLMFDDKAFGRACEQVVLEECMQGTEASFHVITDGESVVPLATAQDYKRVGDGDTGPNTGGMGAVSPSPLFKRDVQATVLREIVMPTLKGLGEEGRRYRGVIFVGLMLTEDGPKVLEYNCRFGDPEAQVILPRLEGDLVPLLEAVIDDQVGSLHLKWKHQAATCVVLASEGYPEKPVTGRVLGGVDRAEQRCLVFHAATKREGDALVSIGGRVLSIVSLAPSLAASRDGAYQAIEQIELEGAHWRKDIGLDLIERMKKKT